MDKISCNNSTVLLHDPDGLGADNSFFFKTFNVIFFDSEFHDQAKGSGLAAPSRVVGPVTRLDIKVILNQNFIIKYAKMIIPVKKRQ